MKGAAFFSLDPEKHWPNFATMVWTDDFDQASDLSRPGIFRLNIGALQAVDLSNRSVPEVGHVISVRLIGSYNTVDLQAEQFLRTCLALRSTMVRLQPF